MRPARHQSQHFDNGLRQFPLRRDLAREFAELFLAGQLAVKQQERDFFEAGLLRHFVNVVAAIHQPGVGIDAANFCFARDHAGQAGTVCWFCFCTHQCVSSYSRLRNVQCSTLNILLSVECFSYWLRKPGQLSAAGS